MHYKVALSSAALAASSSRWLLLNHRPKHDRPAPGGVATTTSSASRFTARIPLLAAQVVVPPNVVRGVPSASLLLDDLEALLDEPTDEKAVY